MSGEGPLRVLIGTLFAGENELQLCRGSVERQEYRHYKHIVLRNLPNKEAHDRLYRSFMEASEDYDLFVKLDADMVFRDRDALGTLVSLFEENPALDHAVLAVHDWYSGRLIEGLHVFSSNARWRRPDDHLFVDESPEIPGQYVRIWDDPAPVVDHAPDPSGLQAFRFGFHRALKLVQPGRAPLLWQQFVRQGKQLTGCWRRFIETEDLRRGHALMGAESVLEGSLEPSLYAENHERLQEVYEVEVATLGPEEVKDRLSRMWKHGDAKRWLGFARATGPFRLVYACLRRLGARIVRWVFDP